MIYRNVEVYGIGELVEEPEGGVSWLRLPRPVHETLEKGQNVDTLCTGVELRFVMHEDTVMLRMAKKTAGLAHTHFHIFRGGIQGSWADHEVDTCVLGTEAQDFVIKRCANREKLHRMAEAAGDPWDPDVVRVLFDGGSFRLIDVIGDVTPPTPEMVPSRTLLCYGSSITHGSNSLDASHMWTAVVGRNLKTDVRNLGFAGTCRMEPALADYLAAEGERGAWQLATLELGINVLGWEEEKARERSSYFIRTVAGRNPDKPVFVISPFYCHNDFFEGGVLATMWRRVLAEVTEALALPNVTMIDGLSLLGDVSLLSADEVHPNIYGVQQIADRLTARIRAVTEG